ncbi:MAG: 4Fe-4S binding protein [Desulfobulbaceae bacterium]|nr:4Fe-4S binding protein [Desulfobulbaceae bacterium]
MSSRPHLLGPWRRTFQICLAALVALIPFLGVNGKALLRLDIPALTLELIGHRFRIEELYLAWLFVLGLIFLFLFLSLIMGRVWCGWACPQTSLADLSEKLLAKKGLRPFRHLIAFLVSLWAGATFVWYFISPGDFFDLLIAGKLGSWPLGTTLIVAAFVFLDFIFVGRLFCREFCPYGRFQTLLVDQGTLCLQATPEQLKRCIDCKSCLRVCPTGIDIRQGYQIECINCARCLDACRVVMARRGEEGIIRYTFGVNDLTWKAMLTPKSIGLGLLVVVIGLTTLFLASHRATASFEIGRSSLISSRLTEGGRQLTFFRGSIASRRQTPQQFILSASSQTGEPLTIKGSTNFTLLGNEKRDLSLAVDTPIIRGGKPLPITFTLVVKEDGSQIEVKAYLAPADLTNQNASK